MVHPWCETFSAWLANAAEPNRTIALNAACDDRVPASRLASMERCVEKLSLENGGFSDYFQQHVENPEVPEFDGCSDPMNHVPQGWDGGDLLWLLDLTGLYPVASFVDFVERRRRRRRVTSVDSADTKNAGKYFKDVLGPVGKPYRPTARQIEYMEHVFAWLSEHRRHPAWVTTYRAFEPHLLAGPKRWLEILGLCRKGNRFLVAIKYPLPEKKALHRPCFADASTSGYHYTTPGKLAPEHGGRTMDLSDPPSSPLLDSEPLPEYIHSHVPWTGESREIVVIGMTGMTDEGKVGGSDVRDYRKRHRDRLAAMELLKPHAEQIARWQH